MKVSRNKHFWTYQGVDKEGNEYSQCDLCKKWRKNGVQIGNKEVPKEREYK